MMGYIKDPEAIYQQSFERVRAATSLDHLPHDIAEIIVRIVHSCGMPDITDDIAFTTDAAEKAAAAIGRGKPIIADCAMVASGITKKFLPLNNPIIMTLYDEGVIETAKKLGTTRSAAAVEKWAEHIDGAIVAIGNAPTALFHLLEKIDQGWPKPAVIIGFPVGFVGAAEAKAALAERRDLSFISLQGRRGGSAMAAAAVNSVSIRAAAIKASVIKTGQKS